MSNIDIIENKNSPLDARLNAALAMAINGINHRSGQMIAFSGAFAEDLMEEYIMPFLIEKQFVVPDNENGGAANGQFIYKDVCKLWLSNLPTETLYTEFSQNSSKVFLINAEIGSHEPESTRACIDMLARATGKDHQIENPHPRDLTLPRSIVFNGIVLCQLNQFSKPFWLSHAATQGLAIELVSLEVPFEEKTFDAKGIANEAEWKACHEYCFDFLDSQFDGYFKKLQGSGKVLNLAESRVLYADFKETTRKYVLPQVPTLRTVKDIIYLTWHNKRNGIYPKGRELIAELRMNAYWENEL